MPDQEVQPMTADEARKQLQLNGINLTSDQRARLNAIASGREVENRSPRHTVSPFGDTTMRAASLADFGDEDTVLCNFPRECSIILPGGRKLTFNQGTNRVPLSLLHHPYLNDHGMEVVDDTLVPADEGTDGAESGEGSGGKSGSEAHGRRGASSAPNASGWASDGKTSTGARTKLALRGSAQK